MVVGMDNPADLPKKGRKPKSLGAAPKAGKQSSPGNRKSTGPSFQLHSGQTSLKPPAENIISGNHGSVQQDAPETLSSESGDAAKTIPTLFLPAARHEGDAQREQEEFKAVNPAPPRLAWKTMVRSAPAPSALKVGRFLLAYVSCNWLHAGRHHRSGKCGRRIKT